MVYTRATFSLSGTYNERQTTTDTTEGSVPTSPTPLMERVLDKGKEREVAELSDMDIDTDSDEDQPRQADWVNNMSRRTPADGAEVQSRSSIAASDAAAMAYPSTPAGSSTAGSLIATPAGADIGDNTRCVSPLSRTSSLNRTLSDYPPLRADHVMPKLRLAYEEATTFMQPIRSADLSRRYLEILDSLRHRNVVWLKAQGIDQMRTFDKNTRNAKAHFRQPTLLYLPVSEWCVHCTDIHEQVRQNLQLHGNRMLWPCAVIETQRTCVACPLYRLETLRGEPPVLPGMGARMPCSFKNFWVNSTAFTRAHATASEPAVATPAVTPAATAVEPVVGTRAVTPAITPAVTPAAATTVSTGSATAPAPSATPAEAKPTIPQAFPAIPSTSVGGSAANPVLIDDDDDESNVKQEEQEQGTIAQRLIGFAREIKTFAVGLEDSKRKIRLMNIEASLRAAAGATNSAETLRQATNNLSNEFITRIVRDELEDTWKAMEDLSEKLS